MKPMTLSDVGDILTLIQTEHNMSSMDDCSKCILSVMPRFNALTGYCECIEFNMIDDTVIKFEVISGIDNIRLKDVVIGWLKSDKVDNDEYLCHHIKNRRKRFRKND